METKTDISLYELAAEDWYVTTIHRNILTKTKYDLILDNEDENKRISFLDMNPVALKSLAKTCRNIAARIASLHIED